MRHARPALRRPGARPPLLLLAALPAAAWPAPAVRRRRTAAPGRSRTASRSTGAQLTVGSKNFTENIVLGQMIGDRLLKSAGAEVLDRTNIPGSIGARAGGRRPTRTPCTSTPAPPGSPTSATPSRSPTRTSSRGGTRRGPEENGLVWLPPAPMNNTYALSRSPTNCEKYGMHDALGRGGAVPHEGPRVTFCVENEFANREDGLPGMEKAYGMKLPAARTCRKMDAGIIYTRASTTRPPRAPAPSARCSPPTAGSRRWT